MKVVEVVGLSNSGKTTLIERLIKELIERGIKVGAIKKSFYHDVQYDKEGKDTFRMECAGALITGAYSKNSAFLYYNYSENHLNFIKKFIEMDYLLIEGDMNLSVPKIYCIGTEPVPEDPLIYALFSINEREEYKNGRIFTLKDISPFVDFIIEKTPPFLPQLDCNKCGFDCKTLLSRILKGKSSEKDCKVLSGNKCNITIEGIPIELSPFLDEMLKNVVKGFLSPLKGYRRGKINIEIEDYGD
ncbi:MAG TPA: molybdopterin-guanine dinucleotide biosynthesis protein B [Candidatus Hydrothermia bacterium]|mgnify:CR=1 FL=1|nr:molybdopterin-guanine dinucleotide biosynthesis protein B [Candidatus Hydrothermia bacterium]HOL24360.1 molybdopterin-guanine dinucleotide biosynthesis protein B [Candidatus Hydrothermia bacterium]